MSEDRDKPKPPPKPEKDIIPTPPKAPTIGDKIRAGQLLSNHLRKIAQEETEFIKGTSDNDRMITKAEALARLMFKLALGWEEEIENVKTGVKIIKMHNPSAGMIALIWDRIEGRSVPLTSGDKQGRTLPKKVSEESKNRLNRMVTGNDGNTD